MLSYILVINQQIQRLFRLLDVVTPLYIKYKNKIERIIGKDTSPIGPFDPTFPGKDASPYSPGRNGSFQSPALKIPILGIMNVDDSNVFTMERFSFLRKEDEGNSSLERIGVSVSALSEIVGKTIIHESDTKNNSTRSFVFIYILFSRVCVP